MTKREASEKVAKLRRVAESATNPHESATAKRQADKIAADYKLTESDLANGRMAAAFDDLVGEIEKIVARSPIAAGLFATGNVIDGVLLQIRALDDSDKSNRLKQIVLVARIGSFLAGDNPRVAEIKTVIETALKNHGLQGIV